MPGFESNVIHGDFLGSLGPILINLCKKNQTKIWGDSLFVLQRLSFQDYFICRYQKASRYLKRLDEMSDRLRCSYRLGGGETKTTLSPRTMIVPSFLVESELVTSSASSSTRFMCWSKLYSLPLTLRPPLSWTSTTLFKLSSKIFAATSDIHRSTGELRLSGEGTLLKIVSLG